MTKLKVVESINKDTRDIRNDSGTSFSIALGSTWSDYSNWYNVDSIIGS